MPKDEKALRYIDISLAALGVVPSMIQSVAELLSLRSRVAAGEEIPIADLDAKLARLSDRSGRIQTAPV